VRLRDVVDLELHPGPDYVSDAIRATGDFYEADILDELARWFAGGTIVDVGAHIGNHAAFLAAFVAHSSIVAFEPVPANRELLRRNVARWPEVTVHGQALGARAGSVRIHVDEANAGHSRIAQDGELEVVQAALDTFGLQDVTLMKIDVEGAELEVLEGAAVTIARWRPLVVIEDWTGPARAAAVLPGYRLAVDWGEAHQTYLFAP
jgi:protein O-GlcNAc transferase